MKKCTTRTGSSSKCQYPPPHREIYLTAIDLSVGDEDTSEPNNSNPSAPEVPHSLTSEDDSLRALLECTINKCGVHKIHETSCTGTCAGTKGHVQPSVSTNQRLWNKIFQPRDSVEQVKDGEDQAAAFKVKEAILRYIKLNDRYVAFTSLLLKSQLYHQTINNNSISSTLTCRDDASNQDIKIKDRSKSKLKTTTRKPISIAVLPRTEAGKPYIPVPSPVQNDNDNNEDENEKSVSLIPFSVSHQYPLVGIAYMDTVDRRINDCKQADLFILGLDIVMFDGHKATMHLYSSIDEFLDVFRQSFAPFEWRCIQNAHDTHTHSHGNTCTDDDDAKIKEFFIRWAMKEAYTKALGTGMATEFSSFETRLYRTDGEELYSLWNTVLVHEDQNQTYIHLKADIAYCANNRKEHWDFIFKPFYRKNLQDRLGLDDIVGCACICVNANAIETEDISLQLNFAHLTLGSVIRFHVPTKDEPHNI